MLFALNLWMRVLKTAVLHSVLRVLRAERKVRLECGLVHNVVKRAMEPAGLDEKSAGVWLNRRLCLACVRQTCLDVVAKGLDFLDKTAHVGYNLPLFKAFWWMLRFDRLDLFDDVVCRYGRFTDLCLDPLWLPLSQKRRLMDWRWQFFPVWRGLRLDRRDRKEVFQAWRRRRDELRLVVRE